MKEVFLFSLFIIFFTNITLKAEDKCVFDSKEIIKQNHCEGQSCTISFKTNEQGYCVARVDVKNSPNIKNVLFNKLKPSNQQKVTQPKPQPQPKPTSNHTPATQTKQRTLLEKLKQKNCQGKNCSFSVKGKWLYLNIDGKKKPYLIPIEQRDIVLERVKQLQPKPTSNHTPATQTKQRTLLEKLKQKNCQGKNCSFSVKGKWLYLNIDGKKKPYLIPIEQRDIVLERVKQLQPKPTSNPTPATQTKQRTLLEKLKQKNCQGKNCSFSVKGKWLYLNIDGKKKPYLIPIEQRDIVLERVKQLQPKPTSNPTPATQTKQKPKENTQTKSNQNDTVAEREYDAGFQNDRAKRKEKISKEDSLLKTDSNNKPEVTTNQEKSVVFQQNQNNKAKDNPSDKTKENLSDKTKDTPKESESKSDSTGFFETTLNSAKNTLLNFIEPETEDNPEPEGSSRGIDSSIPEHNELEEFNNCLSGNSQIESGHCLNGTCPKVQQQKPLIKLGCSYDSMTELIEEERRQNTITQVCREKLLSHAKTCSPCWPSDDKEVSGRIIEQISEKLKKDHPFKGDHKLLKCIAETENSDNVSNLLTYNHCYKCEKNCSSATGLWQVTQSTLGDMLNRNSEFIPKEKFEEICDRHTSQKEDQTTEQKEDQTRQCVSHMTKKDVSVDSESFKYIHNIFLNDVEFQAEITLSALYKKNHYFQRNNGNQIKCTNKYLKDPDTKIYSLYLLMQGYHGQDYDGENLTKKDNARKANKKHAENIIIQCYASKDAKEKLPGYIQKLAETFHNKVQSDDQCTFYRPAYLPYDLGLKDSFKLKIKTISLKIPTEISYKDFFEKGRKIE